MRTHCDRPSSGHGPWCITRPGSSRRVTLLVAGLLAVSGSDAAAQGTRLLRQPNASATHVVVSYASDLWIAPRTGGAARRLTSHPGVESNPRFSPDGRWIAFTGEYGGNPDVYVVSTEGGEPRRLTWHPHNDVVQGWTPDGTRILFASERGTAPVPHPRFWTVPAAGGTPEALRIPRANKGAFSADARRVAYQLVAPWDVEWRNYRGGQAQPIRLIDLASSEEEKVPWAGSHDTDPVWLGNQVYFLSDRNFAVNLYRYDPASRQVAQLTRHRDFDAKQLSAGGGVLTYEVGGYVHVFDPATNRDSPLAITVSGDLPWSREQWKNVAANISGATLSPTGTRALFEARGEVWTVPADKGDVRNLSNTPGAGDRQPAWSPDGKSVAWFSDASGEYKLVVAPQTGLGERKEIALGKPSMYFNPRWSPDSKRIAFTDVGLNLWMVDVATGTPTLVDTDQWMVPARTLDAAWSPDSRWIAYAKRLPSQLHAIFVYDVSAKRSTRITDGLSDALAPAWDRNGKYLYWLASTDLGLNTSWLEMAPYDHPVTRSLYLAVLRKGEPSPFLPQSDDEKASADSAKPVAPPAAGAAPAPPTVAIDFDGLSQRVLAVDVPARNYADLIPGPEGAIFFVESSQASPSPGTLNAEPTTFSLSRHDLATRKAQALVAGVSSYAISADGKKLLYRQGTDWRLVDADKPVPPTAPRLAVTLNMRLDPRAEWRQIFREAWRLQRDFFYVSNIHGADWNEVWRKYSPWVEHVGHRADLTYLLDILGGETSVGHSFVFGGELPEFDRPSIGLLGADLTVQEGRFRVSRILSGENWNPELRAPLSAPGVDVREGDYLLAVNGVDVRPTREAAAWFEGTAGKQVVLTVNQQPTLIGARQVTVVPVASEDGLRSRAWVEDNRRMVDRLSNGRLAYVWLPNTGNGGYTYFNRYFFAQQDREGVVIDERWNGGGSAADYVIDVLRRQLFGYFNNPVGDRALFRTPQAAIWGAKVLVINEMAGSGGDLLPFMFREAKLGPLVGTRTWGGLVGTWDTQQLVDGGIITNPRGGFINPRGEWDVENVGVAPDVEVEMTAKEVNAGRDPQLERGVQEALRQLQAQPVRTMVEPPPPIRVKRP
ncbi:MAG: PD40 domain-containing protein [Gemmatimonadetes bacterium]|nr:PD40 domain-containing protein [Gemmatimonadota bacterium]